MTSLANFLFGPLPRGLAPGGMVMGKLEVESWPEVDRLKGLLMEFRNP